MKHVWFIVLGTMLVTSALLCAWHVAVITSIEKERRVENAALRAELAMLSGYREKFHGE